LEHQSLCCTSSRNRSRRPVLRREQREELEINYREDWTTDEQHEPLENNHHEDWITDTSRRNGLLYSVRQFGTNSLKEGAV
jgi:phenylalanine-4-hydroxylase